ncbi:hypothetical protein ABPG74_019295 [Tetrahymena malaccensis]
MGCIQQKEKNIMQHNQQQNKRLDELLSSSLSTHIVQRIFLSGFQLEDQHMLSLCSALAQCVNLEILDLYLYGVQLGQISGVSNLGAALGKCTKLSKLKLILDQNKIKDEEIQGLGQGLEKCSLLCNFYISLGNNLIESKGISSFFSSLEYCCNFSDFEIILENNLINSEGASGLSKPLGNWRNLTNLSISLEDNKIEKQGVTNLGIYLGNCNKLQNLKLNLRNNIILSEGAQNLVSNLKNCSKLSSLYLDFSQQYCLENHRNQKANFVYKEKDFLDKNFFKTVLIQDLSYSNYLLQVSSFEDNNSIQDDQKDTLIRKWDTETISILFSSENRYFCVSR